MYSPFRNEQGQPKSLDEVAYADLAQLKDLEEGFALEFKRTLERKRPREDPQDHRLVCQFPWRLACHRHRR